MKYKEYKQVSTNVENNRWAEAIEIVDELLSRNKNDEDLQFFGEELSFFQKLGARIRPIRDVANDMDISSYFYEEDSDDGDRLVLYVSGDVSYPHDLSLDVAGYYDDVPWIEGSYSIFVNGNLEVKGDISNSCPNTGVALCVAGGISADYLVGGGSIIEARGLSTIKYAVIGFYNDGAICLDGLSCPLFWSEDGHLMSFNPKVDVDVSPHWVSDDTEEILEILNPAIRETINTQIEEEYAEEIEEDEEFLLDVSLFEKYVADYLFDEDSQSFEHVFSGLFERH